MEAPFEIPGYAPSHLADLYKTNRIEQDSDARLNCSYLGSGRRKQEKVGGLKLESVCEAHPACETCFC